MELTFREYLCAVYCVSVLVNYTYATFKRLEDEWGFGPVILCVFLPVLNALFLGALILDYLRRARIYAKVACLYVFYTARHLVRMMFNGKKG